MDGIVISDAPWRAREAGGPKGTLFGSRDSAHKKGPERTLRPSGPSAICAKVLYAVQAG